jgi:hypothetical protein
MYPIHPIWRVSNFWTFWTISKCWWDSGRAEAEESPSIWTLALPVGLATPATLPCSVLNGNSLLPKLRAVVNTCKYFEGFLSHLWTLNPSQTVELFHWPPLIFTKHISSLIHLDDFTPHHMRPLHFHSTNFVPSIHQLHSLKISCSYRAPTYFLYWQGLMQHMDLQTTIHDQMQKLTSSCVNNVSICPRAWTTHTCTY